MKLFTRLAVLFLVSTALPLFLLNMLIMGKIRYNVSIIILIAAGFLLLSWVYASILRPLDELRRATKKIKDGNLDFTLEAEDDDEIGQLTQDFEEMRLRLKESQEEKLRSDRESKELISNIAHDLKTPLTAIQGYSEGILDGVASSPEKMEKYILGVQQAKEKYKDQISVYLGIEQDVLGKRFEKNDPFDYIIGSVHFVNVADQYLAVDMDKNTTEKIVEFCGDFLIFNHAFFVSA